MTLPNGVVGSAYSSTSLYASGGTTPYSWSISAGSLPAGLSINSSTGAITGTPTTSGGVNFTVKVTDSSSTPKSQTQALSITINTVLAITTTSLPSGVRGIAYSATVGVSGGTSPYTFSITSGALPSCLSLAPSTGVISGSPIAGCVGTANFTVKVTDSGTPTAQTQTQSLSILISAVGYACGTGNEAILTGQYAFELKGFTGLGAFLTYVGSLTLDGAGNIVGGEADANGPGASPQTYNVSGTYSVGSDNRGCATISLNAGTVTLTTRMVLGNISGGVATSGNIIEFDPASIHAFIASGPMVQQTTTTTPSASDFAAFNGTYVHALSGWDSAGSGGRIVCAGIHTNIGAAISDAQEDCNDNNGGSANVTSTNVAGSDGTVTAPDQYGRFLETIGSGASTNQRVIYINSSATEALVMTTKVANANTVVLAGQATEQSNMAFDNGSLGGNFIIYQTGAGTNGGSAELGLLSANGALITGTVYDDLAGVWQTPAPTSCGYTVAANGRMTVGTTGTNCSNSPIFYLSSLNTGVLISTDSGAGEGQMRPQTTPAGGFTATTQAGTYSGGAFDIVGQYDANNQVVTWRGTGTYNFTFVEDSARNDGGVPDIVGIIPGITIAPTGIISITPSPYSNTSVWGLAIDSTHFVYVGGNTGGYPLIFVFGP